MPSNGDLVSICIRKKPKEICNVNDIRSVAVGFGIVDTVRDCGELVFVNFTKITDLRACMEEFRLFGFEVEESKRNAKSGNGKPRHSQSKENLFPSSGQSQPLGSTNSINGDAVPGLSNYSTMNIVSMSSFCLFSGIHHFVLYF